MMKIFRSKRALFYGLFMGAPPYGAILVQFSTEAGIIGLCIQIIGLILVVFHLIEVLVDD